MIQNRILKNLTIEYTKRLFTVLPSTLSLILVAIAFKRPPLILKKNFLFPKTSQTISCFIINKTIPEMSFLKKF
jgi:hypothetical protein